MLDILFLIFFYCPYPYNMPYFIPDASCDRYIEWFEWHAWHNSIMEEFNGYYFVKEVN